MVSRATRSELSTNGLCDWDPNGLIPSGHLGADTLVDTSTQDSDSSGARWPRHAAGRPRRSTSTRWPAGSGRGRGHPSAPEGLPTACRRAVPVAHHRPHPRAGWAWRDRALTPIQLVPVGCHRASPVNTLSGGEARQDLSEVDNHRLGGSASHPASRDHALSHSLGIERLTATGPAQTVIQTDM